ncbi:hypothetical protein IKF15_00105 [Candidatus Saccharibacteria bacterium]|nr:hypothetical protein [Candidatus Saccharibacteria bacterium]
MSMVSAIISLLVAIFKAIPSLKDMVVIAVEKANEANVAEAFSREKEKNERNKNKIKEVLAKKDGKDGEAN